MERHAHEAVRVDREVAVEVLTPRLSRVRAVHHLRQERRPVGDAPSKHRVEDGHERRHCDQLLALRVHQHGLVILTRPCIRGIERLREYRSQVMQQQIVELLQALPLLSHGDALRLACCTPALVARRVVQTPDAALLAPRLRQRQ
eukprot:6681632-Prymnesium_polylepis.1